MNALKFYLGLLTLVSGGLVHATEPALVELVQSVPAETTMGDPQLKSAKDVWIEMIKGARASIDIGQMYLNNVKENGQTGALEAVIRELEAAGKRGVAIRFIISEQMKNTDVPTLERLKKIKNAQVRIYDLGKITSGIIHAKYWVVDRKEVFVGSQNFDWKALDQIHELGIHIIDRTMAFKLTTIFDIDWAIAGGGKVPTEPTAPSVCKTLGEIDVVASPPLLTPKGICHSIPVLISLINQARETLEIQVMDYSLGDNANKWEEIDDALRAAAKRGVKVMLMVSNWSTGKPSIDQLKDLSKVKGIEIKIVTVPELSSGHLAYARLIHGKFMVIDHHTLWLGTSNWSRGYFYNTRGVEVVVQKPEFANDGLKVFERIWSLPYAEFIDINRDYPAPKKD